MAGARVMVVSDSAASIPASLAVRLGVVVVPVRIFMDGGVYAEGVHATNDEILARISAGQKVASAEPTPEVMAETYRRCAAAGATAIVSVHVSGALSKTVESAVAAAASSAIPVTVIDSRTIAAAEGFVALAAASVALEGGSAQAVAAAAEAVMGEGSYFVFTVETLEYLRRGGRVSGAVAAVGSVRGIKPVMQIADGDAAILDRVRRTGPAREEVRRLVEERAASMRRPVGAVALVGDEAVRNGLGIAISGPVYEAVPGASLVANTGPGTYAAAVADMPDAYFKTL